MENFYFKETDIQEVLEVYLYVKFSLPGKSLEIQETMVISLHRGSKPKEYYFI